MFYDRGETVDQLIVDAHHLIIHKRNMLGERFITNATFTVRAGFRFANQFRAI